MLQRFFLLKLLRSEADQLEKLRQSEKRLLNATPGDRPGIEQSIKAVVDEIAQLSRAIQEIKANPSSAAQLQRSASLHPTEGVDAIFVSPPNRGNCDSLQP